MVIFLNEDLAYHSWVTHHRAGYVLDGLRRPSKKLFTIHRASCPAVRLSATRKTHWTTGKDLKACASAAVELLQWAKRETGKEPLPCEICSPLTSAATDILQPGEGRPSFPRLTKEILEYVLDTAIINLDDGDTKYRVTAGEVARDLNKTIGQISAGVFRLQDAGLFQVVNQRGSPKLSESSLIYPTVLALQTLPIFKGESSQQLAKLIDILQKGSF